MYIVPQKKAKADPRLRTSKSRGCLSVCAENLFHRLAHLLQLGIIQSYVCRHFAFSLKYHQELLIEIINDVLIRMVHYVFGITIQRQHVSFYGKPLFVDLVVNYSIVANPRYYKCEVTSYYLILQ